MDVPAVTRWPNLRGQASERREEVNQIPVREQENQQRKNTCPQCLLAGFLISSLHATRTTPRRECKTHGI